MSYEQVRMALEDMNAMEILEMLSLERTDDLLLALDSYLTDNHALVEANFEANGVL